MAQIFHPNMAIGPAGQAAFVSQDVTQVSPWTSPLRAAPWAPWPGHGPCGLLRAPAHTCLAGSFCTIFQLKARSWSSSAAAGRCHGNGAQGPQSCPPASMLLHPISSQQLNVLTPGKGSTHPSNFRFAQLLGNVVLCLSPVASGRSATLFLGKSSSPMSLLSSGTLSTRVWDLLLFSVWSPRRSTFFCYLFSLLCACWAKPIDP